MTSPINRNYYQTPARIPMDEDEREEGEYSLSDLEDEKTLEICDWDSDEDSDIEYYFSSPSTISLSPFGSLGSPTHSLMNAQDSVDDLEGGSFAGQALLDSIMTPRLCANAIALTDLVYQASDAAGDAKKNLNHLFTTFMEQKGQDFLSIRHIDVKVIKALEVSVPGFEFAFSSPSSTFSEQYPPSTYGTCFIAKKS